MKNYYLYNKNSKLISAIPGSKNAVATLYERETTKNQELLAIDNLILKKSVSTYLIKPNDDAPDTVYDDFIYNYEQTKSFPGIISGNYLSIVSPEQIKTSPTSTSAEILEELKRKEFFDINKTLTDFFDRKGFHLECLTPYTSATEPSSIKYKFILIPFLTRHKLTKDKEPIWFPDVSVPKDSSKEDALFKLVEHLTKNKFNLEEASSKIDAKEEYKLEKLIDTNSTPKLTKVANRLIAIYNYLGYDLKFTSNGNGQLLVNCITKQETILFTVHAPMYTTLQHSFIFLVGILNNHLPNLIYPQ